METTHSRKIFVNLAVKDLSRSQEFFRNLGFQFDPKFTEANAACIIITGQAFVMLLAESFFKTFTRRQICDTGTQTEGLFALECGSRARRSPNW